MPTPTRTAVLQSQTFLNIFNLPNHVKAQVMQNMIDAGSTPFSGWSAVALEVDDNSVVVPLAADIIVGAVNNGADTGAPNGCVQKYFILRV